MILSKEDIKKLRYDDAWETGELIDSHEELRLQRDTAAKMLKAANDFFRSAVIRDFLADLTV